MIHARLGWRFDRNQLAYFATTWVLKVNKTIIHCAGAPAPVGTYSQAVVINPSPGKMVWVSGQIGLDPTTGTLVGDDFEAQARQVFQNLSAIALAAGGSLHDVVKLTLFLTDLSEFAKANAIMAEHFPEPYPARSAVGVASLPKGALFEADAVMVLPA
jgi:reactive intermediate/imine deaminase